MASFVFLALMILSLGELNATKYLHTYYGDTSFKDYLTYYCNEASRPYDELYMLEGISMSTETATVTVKAPGKLDFLKHLFTINCPHVNLFVVDMDKLRQQLPSTTHFHGRRIQVVFDLTGVVMHESLFEQILTLFQPLYSRCLACSPFIVLLQVGGNASLLYEWSQQHLESMPLDLQLVLVANDAMAFLDIPTVVHIHPSLDGCVRHPGVLMPKNKRDFRRLRTPPHRCDLNGTTLNASANNLMPVCQFEITKSHITNVRPGVETLFLDYLMQKYKFKTNLIWGSDYWGKKVPGTNENALIGLVANKSSEFALCAISISLRRLEEFDLTDPLDYHAKNFMSQAPNVTKHYWTVSMPFQSEVWTFFGGTILVVTLTLFFMNPKQSPRAVIIMVAQIYLKQPVHIKLNRPGINIKGIIGVLMMSALIISNAYSSVYYSMLAAPQYDPAIDTLEDVSRFTMTDSHRLIIENATLFRQFMTAQQRDPFMYQVGQHLRRTKGVIEYDGQHHDHRIVRMIEDDPQNVAIDTRGRLATIRLLYANKPLHISSGQLNEDLVAYLLQKRSLLTEPFNVLIKRCRETGLIDEWYQRAMKSLKQIRRTVPKTLAPLFYRPFSNVFEYEKGFKVLTLQDMESVFVLWAMALAITFLVFLLELITYFSKPYLNML